MALTVLRRMIPEFNPSGITTINVKAILQFCATLELKPSPEACIAELQEDLQSEVLFHNDMIHGLPDLYRILHDYLVLKELNMSKILTQTVL